MHDLLTYPLVPQVKSANIDAAPRWRDTDEVRR